MQNTKPTPNEKILPSRDISGLLTAEEMQKNMTGITSKSREEFDNWSDSGPRYEGTHGERIAVRISSSDTNGEYAIVESIAAPGCATPMHLHRNEAEHFVIIEGANRIAIGEKIFKASAGASITLPKNVPHSWRNISSESGRMVVILTPGGFEQCIQTIRSSPPEKLEEVAAFYGCYIVGPPLSS